jgi:hypothetical protein
MQTFLRVHSSKIKGTLSGFDRVRFRGTLRLLANLVGFSRFLAFHHVLLMDFKAWSMELTERIRRATAELAGRRQRPVMYLHSCHTDKEALARQIAARDGITAGLICVLTCVESCDTYTLHKNAEAHKLELKPLKGRCLHHYFYVQHPQFGLMQLRLQTWAPFNVFVNINGREWLATQLRQANVGFEQLDNCFADVADWARAQALLDEQLQTNWEAVLGELVREYHPTHAALPIFQQERYYWSAEETEWATDVVFRRAADLAQLYPAFVRHSVTDVGCQNVLHYLGRAGTVTQYREAEITTSVLTRQEGTRCKHALNGNSIKMYDKQGQMLRIETTINNPRQMKVYRPRSDGPQPEYAWQRLRKGVADLHRRTELSQASNERYLEDLASLEHAEPLSQTVAPVCQPTTRNGRRIRALNPWQAADAQILAIVNLAEFAIHGFRNGDVKQRLFGRAARPSNTKAGRTQSLQVTRWFTLLRAHHLIQKVPRTHRYTLTSTGRTIITAILAAQHASTKQLTRLAV